MTDKLAAAFDDRFQDFQTLECDLGIFSNPFQAVADQCHAQFQLELIDLQCSGDLKRAFEENDLVTFYKNYVWEQYPNLAKHALKMASLFGSTYCCEQFFSKMKQCKGKQKGQLTDEHSKNQLKIACSSTKVNIAKALKNVQHQKSY